MNIIAFILITISLFLIFKINPLSLVYTSYESANKHSSLYSKVHKIGKNSGGIISSYLLKYKEIYEMCFEHKKYIFFISLSFIFFALGIVFSFIFSNIFLIISLPLLLAYIPLYIMEILGNRYLKRTKAALENALYLITSSYIRTNDVLKAFEDNIGYIDDKVLIYIFSKFIFECKSSYCHIDSALFNLKNALPLPIFISYCETLSLCIKDSSNMYLLSSYVSDMKEDKKMEKKLIEKIRGMKMEMCMMLSLLILNYPLIYILNPDWFHSLVSTVIGQIVVSITVLFVFLAFAYVNYRIGKIMFENSKYGNSFIKNVSTPLTSIFFTSDL